MITLDFKLLITPFRAVLCEVPNSADLHWPISKEIQVHVFSKKVSLWMWCVKFLSSHEEVAGKIIPWKELKIRITINNDIVTL